MNRCRTILISLCLPILFVQSAWAGPRKPQVSIGIDDFCPYTCLDTNRPGFLVEAVRAILNEAGFELKVTHGSWTRLQMLASEGKIDLLGPLTPFLINKMQLPATKILGGSLQGGFIVRADSSWRYDGLKSLDGLRIGAIKDYSYPEDFLEYFKAAKRQNRFEELVGADANRRLVQMLAGKRFDTIPMLYDVFWYHVWDLKMSADQFKSAGDVVLPADRSDYRLGVFVKNEKQRQALIDVLDKGFVKLNEKGEMKRIQARYGIQEKFKRLKSP